MNKKSRRIVSISVIIIILFVIAYFFNIFNINYLINGITVEKEINDNIITTTTTGKSLQLPDILKDNNISIITDDKIIKSSIMLNTKNNNQIITIDVKSNKTAKEIFDYFKEKHQASITASKDNISTIVAGSAEKLIKITIEDNTDFVKYTIKLDLK